ncbi:hypothetical protein CJ030_MR1G011832 [Morella rubra]|uniref:Uncharacterized protein n=1 Tax=Morella rubra TaxID=262757 RepID=A0A6A1WNH3_9ROSI|nr:hypothetical protein CJ030_MR1G011832 [Morella rubra]
MGKQDPTADQLTVTIRGVTVTMSADAIAKFLHIPRATFPLEGDAPLPPPPKSDAHPPPIPKAHAIAGEVVGLHTFIEEKIAPITSELQYIDTRIAFIKDQVV